MEPLFDTIPAAQKLRLRNGTVLHDTAIIPGFISLEMADATWAALCARPDCYAGTPLTLDFENPRWVTGASSELNYRGRDIPRDKMWLQRNMATMLRYGYTGWQWAVSAGTYRLGSIPELEALIDTADDKLGFEHTHNHWIATRYAGGKEKIGLHSDKVQDWVLGSAFVVYKLGAARPFVFAQDVGGKDVEIYNAVLQPGTAVIVGYDANQKVKHGVPAVAASAPSGSIVGRCIATSVPWPTVQKNIQKSAQTKARTQARKRARK